MQSTITYFLVVLLLWSGLNTIEAPRAFAQPSPEQQYIIVHAGGLAAAREGSVEHHHLDDLPSQAQTDPSNETPGLMPTPLGPWAPFPTLSRHRPLLSIAADSPFHAGLLRPPCGCAVTS